MLLTEFNSNTAITLSPETHYSTQILNHVHVDETRKQQCFLAIEGTLALTQRQCMTFMPIEACQHQQF